jgi:zinc transport system substrate-binding protein
LSLLIDRAKRQRAQAIFVQAQFPVNAAKTIANAAGAELISLDPLSPDWLGNIRLMGNALKSAAANSLEPSFRAADDTER